MNSHHHREFKLPKDNSPVPANLYAKILEDIEKQNQKEARLQQGPSLLEERYTPLKDTPLVDEMYQLFSQQQAYRTSRIK